MFGFISVAKLQPFFTSPAFLSVFNLLDMTKMRNFAVNNIGRNGKNDI